MADEPVQFGELIRRHRVACGLTQEDLAERSGLSVRAISDIERGRTTHPHRTSVVHLAESLGLDSAAQAELAAASGRDDGQAEGSPMPPHVPGLAARTVPGGLPPGPPSPAAAADRLPGAALASPPAPQAVPHQLPAGVAHFVGRAAQIEALNALLRYRNRARGTVVISAISGTAGIGKTALALHWAHLVADEFRDGQLYVNLRGFDPSGQPVTPAAAVSGFLDALHVPGDKVPASSEAQAGLYRSLAAGRRMLIILDNALDADQVRPLLPASPTCLVLVTSRNQMADLVAAEGAHPLALDLLAEDEAGELLARRLGEKRLAAEGDAARQLTDLCARLPLALSIAAARAVTHPHFPLASLAAELQDTRRRLDALDLGEGPSRLRAVFSGSYQLLSEPAARVFRLLGTHPGPDVGAASAASLADIPVHRAREALAELHHANLLTEPVPGRFAFHDLLRAYAAELAASIDGEAEEDAARSRLLEYYLHAAATAMDVLFPVERELRPRIPPSDAASELADPVAARAWLEAERASLIAATVQAADHRQPSQAILIVNTMSDYLLGISHYGDAIALHSCARRAARDTGDLTGEAAQLSSLGDTEFLLGHHHQALDCHRQALALTRQAGDRVGEARALNGLGVSELELGQYQQAVRHLRLSVGLCRETGERHGLVITLGNLGRAELRLGRCEQAARHLRQALAVSRPGGDDSEEPRTAGHANALQCLGEVELAFGHQQRASDRLHQAMAITRRVGTLRVQGKTLHTLALAELAAGHHRQARDYLQQALTVVRQTGYRVGEAQATNTLGSVLLAEGDYGRARAEYGRALALASLTGARYEQARAQDGLGHACDATGDHGQAREHWQQALTLYSAIGVPEADTVRAQLMDGAATAQTAGAG